MLMGNWPSLAPVRMTRFSGHGTQTRKSKQVAHEKRQKTAKNPASHDAGL
jgi:hypothetical protein